MPKSLRLLLLLGLLAVIALPVSASSIYSDRGTFQGALSSFFTDNYENPNYMFIQNDAQMTAVEGQTAYMSTGFSNLDIVFTGISVLAPNSLALYTRRGIPAHNYFLW